MRKASGFTLIELIVTLAVAGILAALAVPNFKTTIQNNRLVTESNDLLAALLYARSQAINTGTTQSNIAGSTPVYVTVCAANSTGTACSAGNTWASNGWIVMGYTTAPTAAPGSATNLGAQTYAPIRVYAALPTGTSLNATEYGNSIYFTYNGSLQTTPSGTNTYFFLCDSRGVNYGRAIYLGASGEARVSTTAGKLLDGVTAMPSC